MPYLTVSMNYQNSFVVFDSMFRLVFLTNSLPIVSYPFVLDILHPYSSVEDGVQLLHEAAKVDTTIAIIVNS